MRVRALRSGNAKFATKKMNLMTEIPQPLGGAIEVPLGSAGQIEPLMGQGDLHGRFSFSP